MKFKLFSIIIISISFFSCTPNPCGDLYVRKINPYTDDGIRTYLKSGDGNRETDLPYTGRCSNYSNDILSSIQQYKDGFDHGKWIFYFQNGNIETVGKFNEGKRVGNWKYYFDNKNLRRVSTYNYKGERDGTWFELNIEGDTLWTVDYSSVKDDLN